MPCTTRRLHMKALAGKGHNRPAWRSILYIAMKEEFKHLPYLDVKLITEAVRKVTVALVLYTN